MTTNTNTTGGIEPTKAEFRPNPSLLKETGSISRFCHLFLGGVSA